MQRHQHPARIDNAEPGIDQPIDIKRKADGRFMAARRGNDIIGAATADLAGHTVAEQRKADPGLIFKAVALGRIECHGNARQAIDQGGDRVEPGLDGIRQRQRGQPGQCGGRRAGGGDQRHKGFGAKRHQPAGILAIEQRLHLGKAGATDRPAGGSEIGDQCRQGDIERQPGDAGAGKRFHGKADDFGCGNRGVAADQLDAGLNTFALWRQLRAAHPQHGAGIGQAQRPRRAGQPRHGDAADLAGDVRPQGERVLADRIGKAQQFAPRRTAEAAAQRFLIFDQRRLDAFIAVGGKARREAAHQRCGCFCLRWQAVAQAFGQEAGGDHAMGAVRAPLSRRASRESTSPRRGEVTKPLPVRPLAASGDAERSDSAQTEPGEGRLAKITRTPVPSPS